MGREQDIRNASRQFDRLLADEILLKRIRGRVDAVQGASTPSAPIEVSNPKATNVRREVVAPMESHIPWREGIEQFGQGALGMAKQFAYGALQGTGEAAEALDHMPGNPMSLLNYLGIDTPNQRINKRLRELEAPHSLGERVANQAGQFLPDVVGGVKGAKIVKAVRNERNIARAKQLVEMLPKKYNMTKELAEKWAKPDPGKGHHGPIPQRTGRKYDIPKAVMDSCFNVVHPDGISRFDMYKDHYGLDDHMHGGRLPNDMGRGWSGRKMGFERYGRGMRLWKGTPNCTKYAAGIGGLLLLNGMLDDDGN